ncbi:MAG: hypothetical protein Kow0059_09560 [Candidatus Sumerlaeia bacterium]
MNPSDKQIWLFRCTLSVDNLAAAWLVSRFGRGAEVQFVSDPERTAGSLQQGIGQSNFSEGTSTLFLPERAGSRFESALVHFAPDDPALRKLAALVRECDHRSETPPPLAVSLTALVEGWRLLPLPASTDGSQYGPARARQTLVYAMPVFDAVYAYFCNLFEGPTH